jgi:molybdopterin converting factor small subunit
MPIEVRIPTILRKHTEGARTVDGQGATLRELIEDLDRRHPGMRAAVLDDSGELHRFLNMYLNDEDVRFLGTLETPVKDGDIVSILPAVAGG